MRIGFGLRRKQQHRRGFTIVEMLVSISIIAVLVALLLPALGSGRQSANRLVSRANLRSIGQAFKLYTAANRSHYPSAVAERVYPTAVPGLFTTIAHWDTNLWWPFLLEDMAWDENRKLFLAPGALREFGSSVTVLNGPPSYTYSHSFVARPEVWSETGSVSDALLRGVRSDEVVYPSGKVLLWEWELPYVRRQLRWAGSDLAEPVPMAFADGHVIDRTPSEASEPVRNPFAESPSRDSRLHNTRSGVRRRDY